MALATVAAVGIGAAPAPAAADEAPLAFRAPTLGEQFIQCGLQLLAGYSSSLWRYNVALVESTQEALDRVVAAHSTGQPVGDTSAEVFNLGFGDSLAPPRVDSDFVNCLEHAATTTVAQPQDDDPAALFLRDLGSGQG
jgi:hypothetical protein